MPSYTHMRRAMPVLVSHFLLSHAAALRRDHDRLEAAREEANALTLGSGAIAGTGYAVDTAFLADTLGFSRVVLNSMDASSDRDFAASFLHAVSLAMVHLSRIAEDFILMTSEEFGFFELADSSATGSSMMPQKKNPDPLDQLPLDEGMHVFVVAVHPRRIGAAALEDRLQAFGDRLGVSGIEHAGARQRFRPREAAPHIVFEQAAIEWKRHAEIERRGIRRGIKSSRPQSFSHG